MAKKPQLPKIDPPRVLVGVDLVEIARVERALARTPGLVKRLFTLDERIYCEHRARPAASYAARFAAREAVLKALGTGFSGMGWQDVSVVLDDDGRPLARLTGAAQERADALGVTEVAISLSHTEEIACANAVLLTEAVRPAPKPRQKAESEADRALRASFKNARSIVWDLDAGSPETDRSRKDRSEPA